MAFPKERQIFVRSVNILAKRSTNVVFPIVCPINDWLSSGKQDNGHFFYY